MNTPEPILRVMQEADPDICLLASLHFSAAPDVAAALIVGARSEEQVLANVTSMQARIPPEFWAELKRQRLIEQNALTPG